MLYMERVKSENLMPLRMYEHSLVRLLIHNVRKSSYSSTEYEQFTENGCMYLFADLTSFCLSMCVTVFTFIPYETYLFAFLLVVSFCSIDQEKWPVHLSRQRVGYATKMVSSAIDYCFNLFQTELSHLQAQVSLWQWTMVTVGIVHIYASIDQSNMR